MPEYRVSGLFTYPVKSCRAITLQNARVTPYGLEYDRRWLVVDDKGRFLTQRRFPRMALITAEPEAIDQKLLLRAPDMEPLTVLISGGSVTQIRIWGFEGPALDLGDQAAAWLSQYLGIDCRLVTASADFDRSAGGNNLPGHKILFADNYPFLLISQASLDHLNSRLAKPVAMNRFRPNIVVSGCLPHAEDHWHTLKIGNMTFEAVKRCARCTVPQVNQESGATGDEPTVTLAGYRQDEDGEIYFGQNLIHKTPAGTMRIGDPVVIID